MRYFKTRTKLAEQESLALVLLLLWMSRRNLRRLGGGTGPRPVGLAKSSICTWGGSRPRCT